MRAKRPRHLYGKGLSISQHMRRNRTECLGARRFAWKRTGVNEGAGGSVGDAFLYLLGSLCDSHPSVVEFTRKYLHRWLDRFNQSSPPLSDALEDRLRVAFQNARATLTSDVARELEFILRHAAARRATAAADG